MKVAKVYYNGRSRRHSRRGPSDKRYSWQKTTSGVPEHPEVVDNVEDALYFEDNEIFDVQWTPLGEIAKKSEGPATEAEATLTHMGYREKQRLASALGLKASGKEEELTERLEPEVERLKQELEHNG
jgi:hypothetical protein